MQYPHYLSMKKTPKYPIKLVCLSSVLAPKFKLIGAGVYSDFGPLIPTKTTFILAIIYHFNCNNILQDSLCSKVINCQFCDISQLLRF